MASHKAFALYDPFHITASPLHNDDIQRFNQFNTIRPLKSYETPVDLFNYLKNVAREMPMNNESACFISNLSIEPFYAHQWSNDMFKREGSLEMKPITMSTIKSDEFYNPRQSFGKIRSTFHMLFRRRNIYLPYPYSKSDIVVKSIRIIGNDMPPTITLQWERIPINYDKHKIIIQSIDCILDDGVYLPCDPFRIPNVSPFEVAFDRWTIDDIVNVSQIEILHEPVYS
jgi:hypothetical protein